MHPFVPIRGWGGELEGCRTNDRKIYPSQCYTDRKQFTCKGTLRQVFISLRPPPLLGFGLGRSGNFAGSESCRNRVLKLLHNMVSNATQHPPPHPLPATHCLYILSS
jgi:hypothetical protein